MAGQMDNYYLRTRGYLTLDVAMGIRRSSSKSISTAMSAVALMCQRKAVSPAVSPLCPPISDNLPHSSADIIEKSHGTRYSFIIERLGRFLEELADC